MEFISILFLCFIFAIFFIARDELEAINNFFKKPKYKYSKSFLRKEKEKNKERN